MYCAHCNVTTEYSYSLAIQQKPKTAVYSELNDGTKYTLLSRIMVPFHRMTKVAEAIWYHYDFFELVQKLCLI